MADDRAQRQHHDDRVVGVAEDRDEVGNQVDRKHQVDQEQHQPDTDATGEFSVSGQPSQQYDGVGQ